MIYFTQKQKDKLNRDFVADKLGEGYFFMNPTPPLQNEFLIAENETNRVIARNHDLFIAVRDAIEVLKTEYATAKGI